MCGLSSWEKSERIKAKVWAAGALKGHTSFSLNSWDSVFIFDRAGFRMVSCGRDNIRLWRLRNGTLRSCPVNLGEYHSMDFTDVAFEEGNSSDRCVDDRTLLVSKPVPVLFRTEIRTNHIRINKKYSQKINIFTPLWLFLIGLPAVGVAIYLRLTTAESLSGISGGCCLHSSSMKPAKRNGLLTQVCLEPVRLRKCWEKKNSSEQNLCACPRSRYCHQQHQRVSIILLHGLGGRLPEAMAAWLFCSLPRGW